MNGNGGTVSSKIVSKEAAKTVMSGPASGVIAATYVSKLSKVKNIITYDMGGTSTDVSLVVNNKPAVSSETEIEYSMPVHVPMVDVRTIGAGGGQSLRLMKLVYLKLVLKVLDLIQVQYVMEMEEKILLYQMQIFYLED